MLESSIAALVLLSEYREQRQRFFPSENSLQWYVRQHKRGLAGAGALLLHTGRWYVNAARFDAYVMEAAGKAAAAQPQAA